MTIEYYSILAKTFLNQGKTLLDDLPVHKHTDFAIPENWSLYQYSEAIPSLNLSAS